MVHLVLKPQILVMWFRGRATLFFPGYLYKMSLRSALSKHLGENFLAEKMREASLALLLKLFDNSLSV